MNNKIPEVKNDVVKCGCGKSSIEIVPVSECSYFVNTNNVLYHHKHDVTTFTCGYCEKEFDTIVDTDMILEFNEIEPIKEKRAKTFTKEMPKNGKDLVVEYDFSYKKGKEISQKLLKNRVLVGSDSTKDYYIKRQTVNLQRDGILLNNYKEFNNGLGCILKEQLTIHGHDPKSFTLIVKEYDAKYDIEKYITRTRILKWCEDTDNIQPSMPMDAFFIVMNILGVKISIKGKYS